MAKQLLKLSKITTIKDANKILRMIDTYEQSLEKYKAKKSEYDKWMQNYECQRRIHFEEEQNLHRFLLKQSAAREPEVIRRTKPRIAHLKVGSIHGYFGSNIITIAGQKYRKESRENYETMRAEVEGSHSGMDQYRSLCKKTETSYQDWILKSLGSQVTPQMRRRLLSMGLKLWLISLLLIKKH